MPLPAVPQMHGSLANSHFYKTTNLGVATMSLMTSNLRKPVTLRLKTRAFGLCSIARRDQNPALASTAQTRIHQSPQHVRSFGIPAAVLSVWSAAQVPDSLDRSANAFRTQSGSELIVTPHEILQLADFFVSEQRERNEAKGRIQVNWSPQRSFHLRGLSDGGLRNGSAGDGDDANVVLLAEALRRGRNLGGACQFHR